MPHFHAGHVALDHSVSQPFLAQAQGKTVLVFSETAVIMVARQRFQMSESAQFHSKDDLPNSMRNLLKQMESLCWIGHSRVLNHFLPKQSLNQLFDQLLKQDDGSTTESVMGVAESTGESSLVKSRLNKLLDQ